MTEQQKASQAEDKTGVVCLSVLEWFEGGEIGILPDPQTSVFQTARTSLGESLRQQVRRLFGGLIPSA